MASGCGHSKFLLTHTLSHSFPYQCPPNQNLIPTPMNNTNSEISSKSFYTLQKDLTTFYLQVSINWSKYIEYEEYFTDGTFESSSLVFVAVTLIIVGES